MIQGKVYVTKSLIDALAAAIDAKGSTTGGGTLAQLTTKVNNIPTGGSDNLPAWLSDTLTILDFDGTAVAQGAFSNHTNGGAGITFNLAHLSSIPSGAFQGTMIAGLSAPSAAGMSGMPWSGCSFPTAQQRPNGITISLPGIVTLVNATLHGLGSGSASPCPVLFRLPNLSNFMSSAYGLFAYMYMSQSANGIAEIVQNAQKDALPASGIRVYVPLLTALQNNDCARMASLRTAELDNIVTLGNGIFQQASNLTTVKLSAIQSIGSGCFQSCSALTSLILDIGDSANLPSLADGYAFYSTPIASGTGYIYVTDSRVAELKAATNWSAFAAQIRPLSEYVAA